MRKTLVLLTMALVLFPSMAEAKQHRSSSHMQERHLQDEREQVQTRFLNRFGGLGFSRLLTFDKTGSLYWAQVRTIRGNVAQIDIDPLTGHIVALGAPTMYTSQSPGPATSYPRTPMNQNLDTGCVAHWKDLNDTINTLGPQYELQARRMMLDVWDMHASDLTDECQDLRQNLEAYIRQAKGM